MPLNVGYHHIKIGDVTVTALNDGQFEAPAAWVAGLDEAGLQAKLHETFRPFPPRITLNAFLLETAGRTILVDAGAGGKFGPGMGAVARHLETLGVSPDSVETILLTHAHTDHVGGLTDASGAPLFPKAELVVNEIESAFWLDDGNAAKAPDGAQDSFKAARVGLNAYADRTRQIRDGVEVVPGITARLLPGHTFGHTGFQITSGNQSLLIWGDIVHLPGVQFDLPDVAMAFDADLAQAIATRKAILDEAAHDRIMIAGMHLDFPTFAFIRRHAGRYEADHIVWTPSV